MHISKKIIKEFGGDVEVNSILNLGSEFIFNFMLDKRSLNNLNQVKRICNPNSKTYQKILLPGSNESEEEQKLDEGKKPKRRSACRIEIDNSSGDETVDFQDHYSKSFIGSGKIDSAYQ